MTNREETRRASRGKRTPPAQAAMLTLDLLFTDTPHRELARKYGIAESAISYRAARLFSSLPPAQRKIFRARNALIRTTKSGAGIDWLNGKTKDYTL